MSLVIPLQAEKRKEIASYGASGMKVRVLDETFRDIRYVRVQWRQGNLRTKSWAYTRKNIITAKRYAQAIAEGRLMPPERGALTLARGWATYAAAEFPVLRARTRAIYKSRWFTFEATQSTDRFCEDLNGNHLDEFVKQSRANGAAEYETQQVLAGVKRVLRWLVTRQLIKQSNIKGYRFRSIDIRKLNDELEYTTEEAELILAQFNPTTKRQWRAWAVINLLAHQGVRETSAVHLTWDRVNLEAGVITWDGKYDKTKQTWQQPILDGTRRSFEVAWAMRERCHYTGPWVFFSGCAQGARRKGAKRVSEAERTAEDGTYRIQSLDYQLGKAEERAGITHVKGRALHGFRRMVAGNAYGVLKDAKLAMEFINDTSAMAKKYILRRSDRLQATATAMNAAAAARKAS